jgi:8-oxo-dGTP pyrophosphatase MutT (NUDIX family)
VDVYVCRGREDSLEVLLLRRARGRVRAGTWEAVHGTIDAGETPGDAARRELHEETGCTPMALYNLSRVEQFYLHHSDEIALIPAFVAFIALDAVVRIGEEHDTVMWLSSQDAQDRCTWPRAQRAIGDLVKLLGSGSGGAVEDVLRVTDASPGHRG